jgi:eukaryotic-like serine/threonine-protein kinase
MAIAGGTLVDGRYFVRDRVGSGAMGVVYRAEDVGLGRVVAIKLIDAGIVEAEGVVERFMNEARALARVRHDNVVRIFSYGLHESAPFFVMEHLDGPTLESMIEDAWTRGTTIPIEDTLVILRALAEGLDEVHTHGLVHRDVKPANVIVDGKPPRPVLVDFGLVRAAIGSFGPLSAAGTPMYMAPEQSTDVDGTQVTAASDQYSLACMAFEMLTSRAAFDRRTSQAVILAHLNDAPPRASMYQPELEAADAVISRALAKDPRDRYATCSDFVTHLTRAFAQPTPTSSIRRKRMGTLRMNAPRVLVLADEEKFGKRIVATAERSLEGAVIETFALASDLVTAFEKDAADVVIIDEDASMSELGTVCHVLRRAKGGAAAKVVVLRRAGTETAAGLAAFGVKQLVKPINMHMLASAIS